MFTSVYEHLRAFASAPGRVWSRHYFFYVRARLGAFCHILSSFLVISRPKFFFRVWRETAGCDTGWAGRAAVCSAWFPRRGQDVKNDMTLTPSWLTFAAGPRLRSFMFRTIVLQNRGVCSCWNFQGAFQNGGGFLECSEGAGCSAVVCTVVDAVDMMDTVDGSGSGGDLIHENQLNCGPIVPTGDLHPSPPGAVLQQAREPKPATGETAAIPGTRSPKFGMQPAGQPQRLTETNWWDKTVKNCQDKIVRKKLLNETLFDTRSDCCRSSSPGAADRRHCLRA